MPSARQTLNDEELVNDEFSHCYVIVEKNNLMPFIIILYYVCLFYWKEYACL